MLDCRKLRIFGGRPFVQSMIWNVYLGAVYCDYTANLGEHARKV